MYSIVNYLAIDDPDGNDDQPLAEPNFLTEISHSDKVGSVDKKQLPQDIQNEKNKKKESDK